METFNWPKGGLIRSLEIRSPHEAVITPAVTLGQRPDPHLMNLPDALRVAGMSAEPTLSGHTPVLKVRDYQSPAHLIDTLGQSGFGLPTSPAIPLASPVTPQGGFADRIKAERQTPPSHHR